MGYRRNLQGVESTAQTKISLTGKQRGCKTGEKALSVSL
jgi:hypothetical protein